MSDQSETPKITTTTNDGAILDTVWGYSDHCFYFLWKGLRQNGL